MSDVLDKKEHYTNLALPYMREKHIYAIPLQFNLMTIHAEDKVTNSIDTLEELAGSLEKYHADHPDRATLERWETSNYMEVIFQTYFPELLKDGKLEEKELENFYKNMERIYKAVSYTHLVIAPTFRHDLFRMADLAEEVARFYGYDNIPTTLQRGEATTGKLSFKLRVEEIARDIAEFCGFSQGMTYSFESPKVFDKLLIPSDSPLRNTVDIMNLSLIHI